MISHAALQLVAVHRYLLRLHSIVAVDCSSFPAFQLEAGSFLRTPCAISADFAALAPLAVQRVVTLIGALLWSGFFTKEGFFSDVPENIWAEGPPAGGPPPSRVFRQEIVPENVSAWDRLWGTMVLRKWGNVYVKTSPTTGVVMLLIEKVYPGDAQSTEWTTVDGAKRGQIVNLRNRSVYTLRAQPGIKYSPMVALSSDDWKKTEQASWDVVRRAGGDTGERNFSVVVGSTHRTRAIRNLL